MKRIPLMSKVVLADIFDRDINYYSDIMRLAHMPSRLARWPHHHNLTDFRYFLYKLIIIASLSEQC